MNRMFIRIALPVVAAIVVVACGGGGGGAGFVAPVGGAASTTDTEVLDAFLAYVKTLIATALDTAEPANVTAFDPPTTSETREPIATK
jgi:hypothetical protein